MFFQMRVVKLSKKKLNKFLLSHWLKYRFGSVPIELLMRRIKLKLF